MPLVPGYEVGQFLHSGPRSIVYRGVDASTNTSVILKKHRDAFPTERQLASRRRSFTIGRSLTVAGVVRHLALVPVERDLVLVTEDFGGVSLDRTLREEGAPDVETVLAVGLATATALSELHDAGIVHKDVKPANIVRSQRSGVLKLIDLDISSRLEQEAAELAESALPAGPLTYVSPEQTGRMNHPVDSRSDLYSLGVTLFELFAGRPPFDSPDRRELLHAHLARTPPSLRALAPSVPECVVAVVEKLLSKTPDARYSSAAGLAYDLERCGSRVRAGRGEKFPLAQKDISTRFRLPQRLYGRDVERDRLLAAFERVASGGREALLVAGTAGVGKSSLILELQAPIAARFGWFCIGKFDQFRRDVPYLGWMGALAALVRQLLAEPDEHLEPIRAELRRAMSANGALIAELVPEVTLLLGAQKPVPDVGPAESQARFAQAFRSFVRVLSRSEHPLVLFVDDLQWADLASLHLLEALVSDREGSHLLVLGAYRDSEVGVGHPLTACAGRLADRGYPLPVLELPPLESEHVASMVSDTVGQSREEVEALAGLVHGKTAGNPFFARQFLTTLHRKRLLGFDLDVVRWRWNLSVIAAEDITDNVVDLMSAHLGQLPAETGDALRFASCLGSQFDLRTLARISERAVPRTALNLDSALKGGFLLPLDDDYKLAEAEAAWTEPTGSAPEINPRYRFLHDRVQQAAHAGIDPGTRARIHLRICREQFAAIASQSLEERAVDLMDHLGEAIDLVDSRVERLDFAGACLVAARRAKAAMATGPAARYLEMGRSLLPEDAWLSERRLALDLHIEAAEVAYVAEHFEEAEALASVVLERAETLSDRVPIHNILIGIGVSQQRYVEATLRGVDVLHSELGLRLPRSPKLPHVLLGVLRARLALARRSPEELLELPEMTDPHRRAAMEILMKTVTNAYWGVPMLVPLIACQMVRLSIQHGNIGLSAYGYALYAMMASVGLIGFDTGYRFGKLAIDLLEHTGDRHLVGKTGLLWHGFIRHSKDPLRVCAPEILACFDHALDGGDMENAVYCGTVAYFTDLMAGRSLTWIEKRYGSYVPALLESEQEQTIYVLRVWRQVVANLQDRERVQPRVVGELIDWPARLEELLSQEGSDMAIATVAGGAGFLAFFLDDRDEAKRQFGLLYEREQGAMGQPFWRHCMALYAVVLARETVGVSPSREERRRLTRLRRMLRENARRNPHDFQPFELALRAEEATRKRSDAANLWCAAMEMAQQNGFLYLEAWAAERAATAFGESGYVGMARYLSDRAQTTWQRYGAHARLRLLRRVGSSEASSSESEVVSPGARSGELTGLDFGAILDAVRAVSESIEVGDLVARVLRITLLNAGARRGILLVHDDALSPLAVAEVRDDGGIEIARAASGAPPALPKGLVDYVGRTHEVHVVEDASTHEWLARDPYVVEHGSRSLLGAPLLRHGQLVGLVVLENDLGAGVFTQAHATVVEIIAGQAAVSLENARLFEAQRRQTEAFGRFVPRTFLEQLGRRSIEDVSLGDAVQRRLAVLFNDIRGFTSLSESMSVADNFGLLNAFLARMTASARAEGGFIDEFTGDGVKALFIDGSDTAVRAGISMHARLRQYNRERQAKGRVALSMGAGIHAGEVLLGTIGSPERMTSSVIGDTVNTASRLEGITKAYGANLIISASVRAGLAEPLAYALRPAGRVRVKGRLQPISVHEVLDARPPVERDLLSRTSLVFSQALESYFARDFASAVDGFAECFAKAPHDRLAKVYGDRAAQHLREGVADDWDGVDVRTEK